LVLIIEDDFATRYLLNRLVRQSGRRAVGASTVAAGLSLLATEPDCVVLDLDLPDGDGETILRAVRDRFLDCRVVVCSGVGDQERLRRVRSLSPDAVLTKPFLPQDLFSACAGTPTPA
jgi:two-component system chemotaxis response regulator CheY